MNPTDLPKLPDEIPMPPNPTSPLPRVQSTAIVDITAPVSGTMPTQPFDIVGWAIDRGASSGTGVTAVGLYAIAQPSGSVTSLGLASYGEARSDVASSYGSQFLNSGFRKTVSGGTLSPGSYKLRAYAYSTVAGAWNSNDDVLVTIGGGSNPLIDITAPVSGTMPTQPFDIVGWAIDRGASSGTGVTAVGLYAIAQPSGSVTSLGLASYGEARSDVASSYGSQFLNSGFRKTVSGGTLSPGSYKLRAYAYSTVAGAWNSNDDATVSIDASASISVTPGHSEVRVGDVFSVTIQVDASAASSVDGGQAYLNVDAAKLQVVDASGAITTSVYQCGPLETLLQNEVNNTTGEINYAAGTFGPAAGGPFCLAIVYFKAVASTTSTPITFSATPPRRTDVSSPGLGSILVSHSDGTVTIIP
ncbi:MAG: cohesin domain-containing protein [Bacteroidetes bacterium]|nr:cohesin domain-containing protein [Bacteroidota bacterium]